MQCSGRKCCHSQIFDFQLVYLSKFNHNHGRTDFSSLEVSDKCLQQDRVFSPSTLKLLGCHPRQVAYEKQGVLDATRCNPTPQEQDNHEHPTGSSWAAPCNTPRGLSRAMRNYCISRRATNVRRKAWVGIASSCTAARPTWPDGVEQHPTTPRELLYRCLGEEHQDSLQSTASASLFSPTPGKTFVEHVGQT